MLWCYFLLRIPFILLLFSLVPCVRIYGTLLCLQDLGRQIQDLTANDDPVNRFHV